jgi:DNA-binding GntR family transcriptional regulator
MGSSLPKPETKSNNETIDEKIYDSIVDAILNNQLTPGTRLTEAPLCAAFGVTRGTLRRVFVKLAHEKVIEIQPNRGAIIAAQDIQATKEVFETRSILELGAIKVFAQNPQQKSLTELRKMVDVELQLRESGRWSEWIRQSGEFHLKLAEANQNSIVTGYLRTLIARTSLLIGLYETPKHSNCSASEHSAILDAIEQGKADLAETLMQKHLCEYAAKLLIEPTAPKAINFTDIFSKVSVDKNSNS